MSPEARRYVFAPLEQHGVVVGLRAGQVGLLGGGLLADTLVLRRAPSAVGVGVALVVFVAAAVAAFVPVAGRPLEQWAPPAVRRVGRLATGVHLTRAAAAPSRRSAPAGPGPLLHAPAAFGGLVFDEVARPGGTVGLVRDRSAGTVSAVLAVRGRSFTLLDATDKERRLSTWSAVLAGLSREGGAVRSLQWVERTVPGDAAALVRHMEGARTMAPDSAPARSYADLVAEAGPLGQDHECLVALTVRAGRRRRGPATPVVALLRELRLLEGQLRSAEVDIERALSRRELGAVIRTAFDPWARPGLGRRAALHPDLEGPLPEGAWPVATEESWSWWRTDETWHATFWVAEWPRNEVGADFLSPLLLHRVAQRTVSVVMAPLPPSEGVREAEAARTAQVADEQLRQRAGFLATARRRRDAEGVARREAELSDGHVGYHFSGYITVSARGPEELETAVADVVAAAHQSRLELRRLHGVQDLAFTWTLPLGRGLAGR